MPNVSLGPWFENFIDTQIKTGRYQNASEVVRAGLRLLQESELAFAERRAQLAKSINGAFDEPGEDIPASEVFDRLEHRHAVNVKATRRGA